ncbi:GNAT family N-acetyltransferase [Streptomyces sp. NPDC012888]|uniref:GNAT family N-acetyltransferase n=1 Tax=Streptomyces sp. NPDC012888 TaxID=3364855 RepID=UPI0036BF812E
MTSPEDLVPAAAPPGDEVVIMRAEVPSPEFSRFLYASVGGDIHWTDRLGLTRAEWVAQLERPGVETWVAYDRGTPAGYVEFDPQPDGVVEIVYFGLLPDFRGRRIGGWLLTEGVRRAWDLASRWPDREPTRRVWLHTCSQDGPTAMANYERRGFKLFDTTTEQKPLTPTPGPWPGA